MSSVDLGAARPLSRVQERSRRRILEAAHRMVESGDLDDLSMRDIAAEAEVSVRTIYNVIGEKDRVITSLVLDSFDAIDARLESTQVTEPIERIWEAITTSVDAYIENVPRAIIAAVITDLRLNAAIAPRWTGRRIVCDAIEGAARAGALRGDVAPARLLDQAGPTHAHRLHQWAVGIIDEPSLHAGVLYAYDVSLLAVARPKARTRLLDHMATLEPLLPALIVHDDPVAESL
jgi:AcrR family transcriptional regulator